MACNRVLESERIRGIAVAEEESEDGRVENVEGRGVELLNEEGDENEEGVNSVLELRDEVELAMEALGRT